MVGRKLEKNFPMPQSNQPGKDCGLMEGGWGRVKRREAQEDEEETKSI